MRSPFDRSDINIRSIIAAAAFSALSAVTAQIKLPSTIGSVALDSAPAFFAAGFISPIVGGFVGFAGHLASAATAGFPSGPLHLVIASGMFIVCLSYGAIVRAIDRIWGVWVGTVICVILNCLIPFACIPLGLPKGVAISLVFPFLIIAAFANAGIASVLLIIFSKLRTPGA